jgi:hypothetical protein
MLTLPPYLRLPLLQQHVQSGFGFYQSGFGITIVYDGLLWNSLVVERASKHCGDVHTFHRSTSSVLQSYIGRVPVVGDDLLLPR